MGMLERIKKRQLDGFKEFVQNIEITGRSGRIPIFTAGLIEDPVFMGWVSKNVRTFEDFLKMPSAEIEKVLKHQEQIMGLFAKCLFGGPSDVISILESAVPRIASLVKDEIFYLKEVTQQEKESARFYIVKTVRKLQLEDYIQGFQWKLPPVDVFYNKVHKDGPCKIFFETGVLAAEGVHYKGRRDGSWKHFYESGSPLANGNYAGGIKTSLWTYYYDNGEKRSEGWFIADQRSGLWKEWDFNGEINESRFVDGVKQSA
jgi:hypothetical protein